MDCSLNTTEDRPASVANAATYPAFAATHAGISPKALTPDHLVQLARAMNTLLDVAVSLGGRSTFYNAAGLLNAAGGRFDEMVGVISDAYLGLLDELRETQPRAVSTAEDRSCELLAFDLGCDQDVTDVALAAVRKRFPGKY